MDWTTSIHAVTDADATRRWRALWETSPQRSSFTSAAYARAAANAYGLRCEMHLVTGDGEDEAGAIVHWRQRGPYRQGVIPPMTQYSSVVLRTLPRETDVHYRRSAFEALLASLEERFHVLRLLCPGLPDVRVCQWRDWTATPLYTYRVVLDEAEPLLGTWSSSTRSTFRKHREGFRVREAPESATAIVALCASGYERHGRSLPADAQALIAVMEHLQSDDLLRLFVASPTGSDTVEAGIALLHDGRTAHYWVAGSEPGPAMTVLIGELLIQLREEGFTQFDFVGANTPSIAEFERRFGPSLVPYYFLETQTRPELRLLHALRH